MGLGASVNGEFEGVPEGFEVGARDGPVGSGVGLSEGCFVGLTVLRHVS